MATPAMLEEWQQQPEDYERAFGTPDGYEETYFASMGRYGAHMGDREKSGSWFTDPEAAGEDGVVIRDWWRDMVRRLKPTAEQRDHFLIYTSDLLFMDGDMEQAWADFLVVPREWVREAFDGIGVCTGQEDIEFAQQAYAEGVPAAYARELPRGLRDNLAHPQDLTLFKTMAALGIPTEFLRTVRHHRESGHLYWNIMAWESGVPARTIAEMKGDTLAVIRAVWHEKLPVEYARELYPAYEVA